MVIDGVGGGLCVKEGKSRNSVGSLLILPPSVEVYFPAIASTCMHA